jgi:hypothetical protein
MALCHGHQKNSQEDFMMLFSQPVFGCLGVTSAGLALAFLTACGGGGNDGDGNAPPVNLAPRLAITDTTAPPISAESLQAIDATGNAVGSVAGDSSLSRGVGPAVHKATAAVRGLKMRDVRSQATTTETLTCSGGGSITVTINVAGASLQGGDSLRFVLNSCREAGSTIVGTFLMTLVSVSGTGENLLLTTDVALTDLTTTTAGVTETANGTLRLIIDDTNPAVTQTRATGSSMTTQRIVNGQVVASRTVANFDLRSTLDDATGQGTTTAALIASGTFPRLGEGSFQVETLQPVVTPGGAVRPSSGRLRATGANGGNIVITVQSTGLLLEIDRDGNGTIDATRTLTWAEVDDLVDG